MTSPAVVGQGRLLDVEACSDRAELSVVLAE
jgi:hypothetical protein